MDGEGLNDGVGEKGVGQLGHGVITDIVVHVEFEVLALPDIAYPADAKPAERPHDCLTLGVENLWLENDIDDHTRHALLPGSAESVNDTGRANLTVT